MKNAYLAAFVIFAMPQWMKAAEPQASDKAVEVSVAEIGRTVTLVGRLGQPLGTMVSIRGTWRLPDARSKDQSPHFVVSHVDGRKLARSVALHIDDMHLKGKGGRNVKPPNDEYETLDEQTWTLRGYESGRFSRTPPEYWTESGVGVPAKRGEPPFSFEFIGFREPD